MVPGDLVALVPGDLVALVPGDLVTIWRLRDTVVSGDFATWQQLAGSLRSLDFAPDVRLFVCQMLSVCSLLPDGNVQNQLTFHGSSLPVLATGAVVAAAVTWSYPGDPAQPLQTCREG